MLCEGKWIMRRSFSLLVVALCACGGQDEQQQRQAQSAKAPAAARAIPVQASSLMAIPSDPEAVKRLEAMGYTVHREEGHLHAPGVKGCPAMADGPVM